MCGRYGSTLSVEFIRRLFKAHGSPNLGPNWNVAPTQEVAVIRHHPETGQRRLDALKWGLVPHFSKDTRGLKPINARAETVASSGMFRGAYRTRRAIVPAELFYEWRKLPDGKKQPHAIAREDGAPLAFGGLWESWKDPAGELIRTFTIVTTPANAEMAQLHDRMPLVLEPDDWPLWLGEVEGDPTPLLHPAPDGTLRSWPVSTRVNSVRNNDASLFDRIEDEGDGGGPNPA